MASKIEPMVLDGLKYVVWVIGIEMLMKSKGFLKYMKATIPDPSDASAKISIDGKKDGVTAYITTYIL